MASTQTFYINGPSLSSATSIFTDESLTILAPDGMYSDGEITREQAGGVLLPPLQCGPCYTQCPVSTLVSKPEGVYEFDVQVGGSSNLSTGAIIIKFNPFSIPKGIIAQLSGNKYYAVSSPVFGLLQSSFLDKPTYIGDTAYDCGVVNPLRVLSRYKYNGSAFEDTGLYDSFGVDAGQSQLTAGAPGVCVMVIPKQFTSSTPQALSFLVYGVCNASFDIEIGCPNPLPAFFSTDVGGTDVETCSMSILNEYSVAPVNGDGVTLGLYDWVFSDGFGQSILGDGWYGSPSCPAGYDCFQVIGGVIVAFSSVCSTASGAILNWSVSNQYSGCVEGGVQFVRYTLLDGTTVLDSSDAESSGSYTAGLTFGAPYKLRLTYLTYDLPITDCAGCDSGTIDMHIVDTDNNAQMAGENYVTAQYDTQTIEEIFTPVSTQPIINRYLYIDDYNGCSSATLNWELQNRYPGCLVGGLNNITFELYEGATLLYSNTVSATSPGGSATGTYSLIYGHTYEVKLIVDTQSTPPEYCPISEGGGYSLAIMNNATTPASILTTGNNPMAASTTAYISALITPTLADPIIDILMYVELY